MRAVLRPAVFDPKNNIALSGLLHRALTKRCYVEVMDEHHPRYLGWLNSQDRNVQSTWRTLLDWNLRDKSTFRVKSVCVDDTDVDLWNSSPPCANLGSLIEVLDAPFHILLENGRNDSAFLLAMASSPNRGLIEKLYQDHRVLFDGAGGLGELRKIVEEQVSRHPYRSLRYWALFDSDASAPGRMSAEAALTASACRKAGIPHHVLARRAIENYLPKGALYDWVNENRRDRKDRQRRVDAYYRLNETQRAHFHLKAGLPTEPSEIERGIYSDVSREDWLILSDGVGKRVAELYGTQEPKRLRAFVEKEGADSELHSPIAELIELLRVPNG